uniref:Zn(2)-C6 fungal-type domain-containing protein n=1 Tax=Vannella robusta TaxID=1487602 RepID=A0A7S4HJT4_9EUKA|mmetsp:Transcript_11671/g.14519  ORF Transcript_11671/g.14519 Transcript_11671/m.14519 type:complete len:269 (+) Transcript_11671:79-885(+)
MDRGKGKRKRVREACPLCKKSKTACDARRPCPRCIRLGMEDSCVDNTLPPGRSEVKEKWRNVNKIASFVGEEKPQHSTEHQHLVDLVQQLEETKQEREHKIQQLQSSLQTQAAFSDFALSRWKLHSEACYLVSFSLGFSEVSNYPPSVLSAGFRCLDMYPCEYHHLFRDYHKFMASGGVDSFMTKLPVVRGSGERQDVLAMLQIEFESAVPAFVSASMTPLTPGNTTYANVQYFEPIYTTYKRANPTQQLVLSTGCGPSKQEFTNGRK